MIKNDYPYDDKNIFYAIHSNDKENISNVRLTQSKNQGIYVAPDVLYLTDYIYSMIPPKKIIKELKFYISLSEVDQLVHLFYKKLKSKKLFDKIFDHFFKSKDYFLWGYINNKNIKKVNFIKSKNKDDLVNYFINNKYNVKVFFNLEDLLYLQKELVNVKYGKTDEYNFIVE